MGCIAALTLFISAGLVFVLPERTNHADTGPSSIITTAEGHGPPARDAVWDMLGRVSRARASTDLRRLAGDTPICTLGDCNWISHRLTSSEGLRWAMDYIYAELDGLGYSLEFQDWSRLGASDRHLIARKVGLVAPGEEIYLVAHVDGIKLDSGERFPAADDNASGAADLLEAGRVLSSYSFSRTLVLLFSTGEEQGARGVKSYLGGLPAAERKRITAVVNVDVVGYDANDDAVMELWYGEDPLSLKIAETMSHTIRSYALDLEPLIVGGCD